jgi:DNA-binding GntR family transcriptional regulator
LSLSALQLSPDLIARVRDTLLAAVIDGTLAPGERLTQESVAEKLGVSRQPVSHALQLLKSRGLLTEAGKRGLVVAPVDAKRIRDLYQVREALEALAARLAAGRVGDGLVASADIKDARRALNEGCALGPSARVSELVNADVAFHSVVHRLSGNPAIGETIGEAWPHFMRSMSLVLSVSQTRERVWREHRQILGAILAGKPADAETLARQHTNRAGEETARRLESAKTAA